jgi:hypothetical protein
MGTTKKSMRKATKKMSLKMRKATKELLAASPEEVLEHIKDAVTAHFNES